MGRAEVPTFIGVARQRIIVGTRRDHAALQMECTGGGSRSIHGLHHLDAFVDSRRTHASGIGHHQGGLATGRAPIDDQLVAG